MTNKLKTPIEIAEDIVWRIPALRDHDLEDKIEQAIAAERAEIERLQSELRKIRDKIKSLDDAFAAVNGIVSKLTVPLKKD